VPLRVRRPLDPGDVCAVDLKLLCLASCATTLATLTVYMVTNSARRSRVETARSIFRRSDEQFEVFNRSMQPIVHNTTTSAPTKCTSPTSTASPAVRS
jgi:hypothetical protein